MSHPEFLGAALKVGSRGESRNDDHYRERQRIRGERRRPRNNTNGSSNVFAGGDAGEGNIPGSHNTFVGRGAGFSSASSNDNTFSGDSTGYANTASNNTFLSPGAGRSKLKARPPLAGPPIPVSNARSKKP